MAEPRVVTLEIFADYLNRGGTSTAFIDDVAKRQIVAAEDHVEGKIPYELTPSDDEQRVIYAAGESFVRLPGGLRSATEVLIDGQEFDADVGYRLLRRRGQPAHSMLINAWGAERVEVTGDWGFEECPDELINGICALAARDHFIRLNRGADVTQGADGGASSYYDRIPTVTRTAIASFQIPTV